ncbi:MAG TPA: ABC transporter ATP-binding protein, partial [Plasticicumulans sp.]|nr:ABC transporter ATP-binding protein [Plasticicumulans sp.]HND96919.1 ABC transporter ATP-binding protein [Plasticicumulans sp.]
VPEERLGRAAVPARSLADNTLLTAAGHGLVRAGLIRRPAVLRFARALIEGFQVRCKGAQAPANSLSGGNLQKFIVGRELAQHPQALVIAQPTWGVDVASAALIHEQLLRLRNDGVALLVISEDLDELFGLCDRIAVLAGGRLSPVRETGATDAAELGQWMGGGFGPVTAAAAPGMRDVHA